MQLLVGYAQPGEPEARLHTVLDDQLALAAAGSRSDFIGGYRRKYWLGWKIDLYRKLGRNAEASALIDANLNVPEFRQLKVDTAIEAERWEEAFALIRAGMSLAQQEKFPGLVVQWKKQMLRIALLQNDVSQIRAMALDLFRTDRYQLEYFKTIKASYPPDAWPQVARSIIVELEKREQPAEYLLPILVEEQDWPGMLACIRKDARFDMLLRYEEIFLEHFPEDSEKLYIIWLRQTADRASNRDEYKQVVILLQNLLKYPNGKDNVALLLREFREKFGRRPAMMEELKKVK